MDETDQYVKCPDCGAKNHMGEKMCTLCGVRLDGGEAAPEQKEKPPTPVADPGRPQVSYGKPDPEPETTVRRSAQYGAGGLVIKVVLLLVACGVGFLVFTKVTGSSYGIGPEYPLGQLETLRETLTGQRYHVEAASPMEDEDTGLKGTVHAFTVPNPFDGKDAITVVVNDAGEVRGIGGTFYCKTRKSPDTSRKTGSILNKIWMEAFDKAPHFVNTTSGSGIFMKHLQVAYASNDTLLAEWKVDPVNDNDGFSYVSIYFKDDTGK